MVAKKWGQRVLVVRNLSVAFLYLIVQKLQFTRFSGVNHVSNRVVRWLARKLVYSPRWLAASFVTVKGQFSRYVNRTTLTCVRGTKLLSSPTGTNKWESPGGIIQRRSETQLSMWRYRTLISLNTLQEGKRNSSPAPKGRFRGNSLRKPLAAEWTSAGFSRLLQSMFFV